MDVDLAGNIGERTEAGDVRNLADRNETPEQHFTRCAVEDHEPIVTPAMASRVLEVVLAAQESARTGLVVELA